MGKLKNIIEDLKDVEKRWKDFGGGHMIDYAHYDKDRKRLFRQMKECGIMGVVCAKYYGLIYRKQSNW
jgi:hypothetical protein